MNAITAHAPPAGPGFDSAGSPQPSSAELSCRRCGGSGTLRMGDQQYRTCLDCLGQGRLTPSPANLLTFQSLSAAVGVSDAR
jgi:hypothetical protein